MRTAKEIVGDNIALWAKIGLTPAYSGSGRYMYTHVEFKDTREGTLDWKQIKTKRIPSKLLKTAPIVLGKKHGDLRQFLVVPPEIKRDLELINLRQAKEIQAMIYEYTRGLIHDNPS
jgi:hypothetical protein